MTPKQEKALAALLSESTIEKAAAASGISESTLLRWLKEDEFKEAYRDARREVVAHATTQLQAACSKAVDTLVAVAEDEDAPASSRVSAAKAILDTSIRAVEIDDLAARVEAMEARLGEMGNK